MDRVLTSDTSSSRRPGRRVLAALGVAVLVSYAQDALRADLAPEERRFCEYLIYDLKYYDTARRHLEALARQNPDRDAQGDLAYFELDIVRATEPQKKYLDQLAETQKRFPKHSRSSLGSLPKINAQMGNVITLFTQANDASLAQTTADLREQARQLFGSEVQRPLEQLIEQLNEGVSREQERFAEARRTNSAARESEEFVALKRNRNLAEFARVKIFLIYARMLGPDASHAEEREGVLKQGLEFATAFVEDRAEFPLMQYETQLQKGLIEYELGRYFEAIDDLLILVDIRPPAGRNYPQELVDRFRDLHIQSILFAAKASNADRKYKQTVDLVQRHMLTTREDRYDLSTAENDPKLQKYYVLARLEMAVALAGTGQPEQSLAVIEGIISKYTEQARSNPIAQAYVTDARKALGTIVEVGGVVLSGRAYFEGGLGLYSELKQEEALTLFQFGLASLRDEKERKEVAPDCLDKIGEINYRLERYAEAAMAYLEICDHFPEHPLAAKAAQNALAATSKLTRQSRDHAGYKFLEAQATVVYNKFGADENAIYVAMMAEAQGLERQGKPNQAMEIYKKIPRLGKDGKPIVVYWRAQASIGNILFGQWAQQDPEIRDSKKDHILAVAAELDKVVEGARADGQKDGGVMASFVRGLIFYELADWAEVERSLLPFLEEFKEEATYRGNALFRLVVAGLSQNKVEVAERAYTVLKADFTDAADSQYASLRMADYYSGLGGAENRRRAAEFVKDYAAHKLSASELNDLNQLMDVVDSLIDGGLLAEAESYLERAEKGLNGASTAVKNRILVRRARFAFEKQDYKTVIASIKAFLESSDVGELSGPDAPFTFMMYGEAHLAKYGAKAPGVADAQIAHSSYGRAVTLMNERRGPQNRKEERLFWEWSLRWLQVKWWLSEAGDFNALKDILAFMLQYGREDMGGEDLKAEFEALHDKAKKKFDAQKGR